MVTCGIQQSESEEEGLDEVDDDNEEEEHDHEPEAPVERETVVKKLAEVSLAPKDPERQLSKKELKKKGLEELDAVLAELGCANPEANDSHGNIMICSYFLSLTFHVLSHSFHYNVSMHGHQRKPTNHSI